ncbi:MAG: FHA domain-containing protein, partial [Pseudomonadales bacterium]|nr:FHA domain-containing protein [Pseudomonadales bacterium]
MKLVLSVITCPEGCGLEGQTEEFGESGGSFGRGPANQWILPDPNRHVSSTHGRICFEAGTFYIVDSSTNGIYFNDDEYPLGPDNKQVLTDGDQLLFGDYTLQISIINAEQS